MIRVSILGTGNVAKHLFATFMKIEDVKVVQIIGRNKIALKIFGNSVDTLSDFSKISDADIFIIAVKDDAIAAVSEYLRNKKGLIAHTSGSVSMDVLSGQRRHGVFYPLQTFTDDRKVAKNSVPYCLEAHDETDLDLLKNLAGKLSDKVYEVNSEQRKVLHLAAVFVNNFTNHLYHIGKEICDEKGLPFAILQPLIQETLDKTKQLTPYQAQTGPARRGDSETISKHLEELKKSGFGEVYGVLSKSIGKLYGKDTNGQHH
ncbi:protein of unknown function [Pricia antarctica]|uniref:DUF2520 domain-containing protein n=1 Tax=Pricia antarctica TaxID=641691 RepID=A0A1G7FDM4_9FLAO|nr:DUF2520 domain-containing protein [Pricia antarctica]SDE73966.1 protein of unknown function [Pricia antarctica]